MTMFKLPRMLSPRNKSKACENSKEIVEHAMERLSELFTEWLSKARYWNQTEWRNNAGVYADVNAIKECVMDNDCFGLYEADEDPEVRKLRDGLDVDQTLPGKFFRRMMVSGAEEVFGHIMETAEAGNAWPARSMDPNVIAGLLGIEPDKEEGE